MDKENLKTDEISEFLKKIDPEHFNCVYSCNGMTLLRSEEYDYRLKYIIKLRRENKKQKEVIDKARNNLDKDMSMIKTIPMSKKEIIARLEITDKMLRVMSE